MTLYAAAIDDHLNAHGYIIPGFGDVGTAGYAGAYLAQNKLITYEQMTIKSSY
ncbi:MAG: hypothetical protein V7K26_04925 [Nostoc sp.]|uniref:hypothetical protein n=1 Tax=Nostoc sp. TaxID=1180 RepID=UPI002FF298D4